MLKTYTRRVASPLLTLFLMLQAPASHAGSASTTAAAPAIVVAASQEEALAARINSEIAPLFKANEPGATIIVTRDGLTVFRQAYGMADVT